ncbi:hypothetical protein BDB00DRAFT_825957 [Zychaea mexicana]|uniref:uncharacterized protein n=1 Tax=Zychaea mexicana TaxID=64656 RepID=UPI0022FE0D98|nr:uncharacterized protein BDB00DRAFT_825957 [Zychaea mexicana]KAI9492877.1 hypothetical protein BDB00DRAFT_825957 [Zychaea mexicana]
MSLESAIEYLQSKTVPSVQLSPPAKTINDLLLDATNTKHNKRQTRIRNAEAHERQLWNMSGDDAVLGRHRTALDRANLAGSGGPRDLEQLLAAASNLNKVCNIADIEDIIERLRQEQDTHQTDLDYLTTTFNENKIEMERLRKLAAKRKSDKQHDPMEIDPVPDQKSAQEAERQAQLENELKELESSIARRKEELEQASEELRRYQELKVPRQEQPAISTPVPPSPVQVTNDSSSNLQLSLQEILKDPSASTTDKLSMVRRELLRNIMANTDTTGMAKVMAKVIQLLEAEPSHRILLNDLKQKATDYANGFDLNNSAGSQAIYKLNAYKLVIIDRTQEQAFVQLT